MENENEVAPNGRCNVCDKVCPFEHDVPHDSGELVCDMCAGAPKGKIDW